MRTLVAAAGVVLALAADGRCQPGRPRPAPTRVAAQPAGEAAEAMAAAWLHELLGSEPATALAAYRAVAADEAAEPEQRIRAAARALPLAAAAGEEPVAWARRLLELVPGRDTREAEPLVERLRAAQANLRSWAASGSGAGDGERARALLARLIGEPWRALDTLASRSVRPAELRDRQGRNEARGPAARTGPRPEPEPRPETEPLRPRLLQLRRWSADALELELAGHRAQAQRLLGVLGRRRPVRGPLTLPRLEEEMQRATSARWSDLERALLERVLTVARERAAAGDQRGTAALVAPALMLLAWARD
jgi:hypothetical protein